MIYWLASSTPDIMLTSLLLQPSTTTCCDRFDRNSLREISGTYWLTWVSLAIVSRLTRIIRSIDPTVTNFQVNDPDLCEICGDENHNLPLSLLLNLLYYTIEKCWFESHSDIALKICIIFYSYYIVTRGYLYIYTPCWLCMFCKY